MHITGQGPGLRNDLYCVEWDVKLYYTYTIQIHHPLRSSQNWLKSQDVYVISVAAIKNNKVK